MTGQISETYSEYKESDRNWLGAIPAHWSAFALKFLSSERVKDGPHETPTFVDYGIPFFSVDGIQDNELVLEGCRFISEFDHERYSQKCRPTTGDVLLGKAASVGKVAHVQLTEPFNVWSPLAVIRPQDQRMGRYIYYAIQSTFLQAQCLVQSNSNTQNNLSMRAIDNLCFPAPPVAEQTQIAKFLDYETAKIDALIEKQQQLIALLKEKRQAVISHAVTKGLNPDAPMRDSGIEWLGEVPAHWEVCQLKFNTIEMQTGPFGSQLHAEDYVEGGIPLVNPAHMVDGGITPESGCSVDPKTHERLNRHKLSEGDVIFARRGELGRCAVVRAEHAGWLCGTGSLRATLSPKLSPNYAFMLVSSDGVRTELSLESRGSTMDNLNTSTLGKIRLPVPPREEQEAILRHVEEVAGTFDSIEANASQQAELLTERRTALISAAVTGKIDVRGWNAPEPQTEAVVA